MNNFITAEGFQKTFRYIKLIEQGLAHNTNMLNAKLSAELDVLVGENAVDLGNGLTHIDIPPI